MAAARETLPRAVVVLGLVSFFNDLASEMVTPLIPVLLAAVLGAGPVALGLVEGVADALASLLRLWSGRLSDRLGRRKGLVVLGYGLSNLVRPLFGLAGHWAGLLALRATDRVGKGLRTAPRDALVADATPGTLRGRAYGLQRGLDNGGAMDGSLLAAAALAWGGLDLRQVILLSALPGLAAVLLIAFGVREPARRAPAASPPLIWAGLPPVMRRFLVVLAVFGLARASETFVVLRGHELGMTVVELLLLWAAFSLAKSLAAARGGRWADRVGLRRFVIRGWIAYAAGFLALATVSSAAALWWAAPAYGLLIGLSEGAERAVVADLATAEASGTAFGWYNMILGLAAIPGGLAFGLVWQVFGAGPAFLCAALVALGAALALQAWALVPAARRTV